MSGNLPKKKFQPILKELSIERAPRSNQTCLFSSSLIAGSRLFGPPINKHVILLLAHKKRKAPLRNLGEGIENPIFIPCLSVSGDGG